MIEYSKNYRKTTGSLSNYYRDESNSGTEGNINYSIKNFFSYKTSITGKLEGNNVEKGYVKIVVSSKYLRNVFDLTMTMILQKNVAMLVKKKLLNITKQIKMLQKIKQIVGI